MNVTCRRAARSLAAAGCLLLGAAGASAETRAQVEPTPLEELSLEELMRVEVTTVAGVPQSRFASPAAVYVITADDLRRSGHRTLAEALRLVPGMFVGRSGASGWVVGARGLNGNVITSTRSLVLVDGRVVFDPLLNGTLWDAVDVVLEDIDRIEVIRGPGATLWGANAVNGVINVITRSAQETQGTFLRLGAGTSEHDFAVFRHGAPLGDGAFRVWAKYADQDSFDLAAGGSAQDQWTRLRGGFRLDAGEPDGVSWTLQGDAYRHPTTRVVSRQPVPGRHLQFAVDVSDDDVQGANLILRAQHGLGEPSGWSAQAYYDETDRQTSRVGLHRQTMDLDLRRWSAWGRQELVWGLQYNATRDEIVDGPTFLFDPGERSWATANGFVQWTTALRPDRVYAMVGSKLTHHDFTGFEVQPSVRLWWTPSDRQTLWAAVSRPVRIPSRLERDGLIVLAYADRGLVAGGPASGEIVPFGVQGDRDLEAEEVLAYEAGHRFRPGPGWEVDTALFYDDYRPLISIPDPVIGTYTNAGHGVTYGLDVSSSWQAGPRLRLDGSYSWLKVEIDGPVLPFEENAAPENLAQLRASWRLDDALELHGALYYVDRHREVQADAYERLDLGVTWRLRPDWSFALWGQNLLDDAHTEASGVAVPRSAFAHLTVRF